MKTVLVPVANGSEDIETVTIVDVLHRAGAEVIVASVEKELTVTCAHRTKITCDARIADVAARDFDLIALPGGMPGAERLRDCAPLVAMLQRQKARNAPYAAICAAPAVALAPHGLLDGRKATAYPGFTDALPAAQDARVVVDGNVVTGQGPGTAMAFALALVELLYGRAKAQQVAAPMLFRD